MTRKSARRSSSSKNPKIAYDVEAFNSAFARKDFMRALEVAQALVQRSPASPLPYELRANALGRLLRLEEAAEAMQRAVELAEAATAEQHLKLAQYQVLAGHSVQAIEVLEKVVLEEPEWIDALVWLSRALHQLGRNDRALVINDHVMALDDRHEEGLLWRSRILDQLMKHSETRETLNKLVEINPRRIGVHNHIASLLVKEAEYDEAEAHYFKELELNPQNGRVYSNLWLTSHYNPAHSEDALFHMAVDWNKRFAEKSSQGRASTNRDVEKQLRIGLLSGGFRMHPVGQMIFPALQNLSSDQFEIVVYSTSQIEDHITQQIRRLAHQWHFVEGLDERQLDQRIRDDEIDILIDMSGAGEGSRYVTLTREPAPIIVKWVGGLINTTGLDSVDYLLSDHIETPEGADKRYTEKLIRLPDDYICYHVPGHVPACNGLPALTNGYITFGCLNNPAKLSAPVLKEWATLLKEVPGSKLLLRGVQFESENFRDKVITTFAGHGISQDRIMMEGGAQHSEFLSSYHRIDIALDTWPYSGGLTTCESLLMGVPVVTKTGPTFAGRHSATHLVNAGLPELVTDSWEGFRARVKELVNDLPNLAVIRAALRTILLNSPVCDGPRFASHLTTALRAIWQRHCEGKTPEALSFSKSGAAQFADEEAPVKLALAAPRRGFDWQLESPVLAVDNGAVLASRPDARELLGSGRVVMLSFDPAGKMETVDHLAQYGEIQHFPYTELGSGQPATLYMGDESEPTSLSPVDPVDDVEAHEIPTVALDSIEGLPAIDVLALDACHDSLAILENASEALKDTLVVQVGVVLEPASEHHPDFASVQSLMRRLGFRFHCFSEERRKHWEAGDDEVASLKASQLESADAVFVPSYDRLNRFDKKQLEKAAFILHSLYRVDDVAFALLGRVGGERSSAFLKSISWEGGDGRVSHDLGGEKRKVFLVGFPKSGTSTIQKALEETGYKSAHWKVGQGFVGELIYQGMEEAGEPWRYLEGYDAITQGDVCIPSQGVNFWPNLDMDVIEKVRKAHPDCLFLLNYRAPEDTASSIERWGDFLDRLKVSDVPGLVFTGDNDKADLREWISHHFDKVREFFEGDDAFLEIDIQDAEAPNKLGEALGVELAWWGGANENKANKKPRLPESPHMSTLEKSLFDKFLRKSQDYFEFGSGGSTVWAVNKGLNVKGVESDSKWVSALKVELGSPCQVEVVDIGPTKEWGFPVDSRASERFPAYSKAIHQYNQSFDLVLVDGRFRVACTMAAIEHLSKNGGKNSGGYIFIHDFWNRPQYHVVLEFLDVVESAESAGVFQVKDDVELSDVKEVWEKYACHPA